MAAVQPKKTRVRRNAQDSQEAIIKTALKLFAERGIEATSFQGLADELGISQGAVMHHYPTKTKLFAACFEAAIEHNRLVLSSIMDPTDDARTLLIKHFRGSWQWLLKYPHDGSLVTLLYYYATFNKEFTRLYEQVKNTARQRIAQYLYAGLRESQFRLDLNVERVAAQLHDYLLGTLVNNATLKLGLNRSLPKDQFESWENMIDLLTKP